MKEETFIETVNGVSFDLMLIINENLQRQEKKSNIEKG